MGTTITQTNKTSSSFHPDAITIFSLAWAGQSLAHMSFFNHWLRTPTPLAWILLVMTIAVILFPGRMRIFLIMLVADIAYYTSQWPFVSNHVLVSTLMSLTILFAILSVCKWKCITAVPVTEAERREIFERSVPVIIAIFVLMYYAIFLSKLNYGFFDLETSCMSAMFFFYTVNNPIIAIIGRLFHIEFLFWLFLVIEVVLPVLLTFRRTRLLGAYIGVPFHLMLGIMSHWSFSSMMLAVYLLIAMPAFLEWLRVILDELGPRRTAWVVRLFRGYVIGLLVVFGVWLVMRGSGQRPNGWSEDFLPLQWLLAASLLSTAILLATLRSHLKNGIFVSTGTQPFLSARPGWLWMFFFAATLNSASPYIGLKTETSVAMYSNMQTEGGVNNHFFMPTMQLFGFADDLVEILDSNDPDIRALRSRHALYDADRNQIDIRINAIELRRAIGQVKTDDLQITYRRDGEIRQYRHGSNDNPDADLDQPLPRWLAKLAYFRPVFKGDKAYCLH